MRKSELKYTREHEWLKVEGSRARVGITSYAQEALGDVVFVELPEVGKEMEIGDVLGVVESVKAASDVYSPCRGKVVAVNDALLSHPELLNRDPYGEGWMVEMEFTELASDLLSEEEYEARLAEEGK